MSTPTRIYRITNNEEGTHRLVRATNAAQAMRHVAASTYEATVASQDDLVRLLGEGATVEEAGASLS